MQLLAQTGISYSDEHLTGDFVQWLVDSARRPAVGEVVMAEVPPGPADLESTLRAAWEDMSQDPEFVAEAQRRNYGPDQALADLQRGLEAPVTTAVDRAAAEMLTLDYRVAEEDDAFVHRVNETEILRIPKAAELAGTVSDTAKVTLYAVFVVIDVLTVVAAAAGVYITQAKEALSKVMAKPLQRFLAWIGANAAKAGQLQRLKEAGDKVGIIVRVLAWLRGTVNVLLFRQL